MNVVIQGLRSKLIVTQGYTPAIVVVHVRGLSARVMPCAITATVSHDKLAADVAKDVMSARVYDG